MHWLAMLCIALHQRQILSTFLSPSQLRVHKDAAQVANDNAGCHHTN